MKWSKEFSDDLNKKADILHEICKKNLENVEIDRLFDNQPERSKREDYKVTTISSYDVPKIEMPIDKDILTKYKFDL